MADKAWFRRMGDAIAVDTNYMRQIYVARDSVSSTQRGSHKQSAEELAMTYMRCLEKEGILCNFTLPTR